MLSSDASPGVAVRLSATSGEVVGRWRGETRRPAGSMVDVELDVVRAYALTDLVTVVPSTGRFSVTDAGHVEATGAVLGLDEHDVLVMDVEGVSLMVDVTGDAPVGLVGSWVSLVLDDVEITPVEYRSAVRTMSSVHRTISCRSRPRSTRRASARSAAL